MLLTIAPEWTKYGNIAAIRASQDIVLEADYIIAFWNGESHGTRNIIETAKRCKKPIKTVIYLK